jgi:hypothetical protein
MKKAPMPAGMRAFKHAREADQTLLRLSTDQAPGPEKTR